MIDRKTLGKRNRTAGHVFERWAKKKFVELGFLFAVTSRSESKAADDAGIDLVNTGDFGVQCKSSKTRPDYITVLKNMPKSLLNIILHKAPGGKVYVIMDYITLEKLISSYVKEHGTEGRTDQALLRDTSSKPKSNKSSPVSRRAKKKE
jgi:hypothetical protein